MRNLFADAALKVKQRKIEEAMGQPDHISIKGLETNSNKMITLEL